MTVQLAAVGSLQLSDLTTATSDYLHDQVEVKIVRVTGNLEPGEDGTLTVKWTNASDPEGVRLTNVLLHLTVAPGSVAKLKVPGSAILQPRLVADFSAPRPASNSLVEVLFIFLPDPFPGSTFDAIDSVLEIGEAAELGLEYEAVGRGTATFSAHIHADVAFEDLFPRGRGTDGTKDAVVR